MTETYYKEANLDIYREGYGSWQNFSQLFAYIWLPHQSLAVSTLLSIQVLPLVNSIRMEGGEHQTCAQARRENKLQQPRSDQFPSCHCWPKSLNPWLSASQLSSRSPISSWTWHNLASDRNFIYSQDVLLKCFDDWKTAPGGKVIGTIMIDLSKEFKSICTPFVWGSLMLLEFVTKLSPGSAATFWEEDEGCTLTAFTERRAVKTGLPQGSIPGQLIFLIFVNDLPTMVQHFSSSLHDDDTSIHVSHPDP